MLSEEHLSSSSLFTKNQANFARAGKELKTTRNSHATLPAIIPPTTHPPQLTCLVVAGPVPFVVSSKIIRDPCGQTRKGTFSLPNYSLHWQREETH